MFNFFFFSHKKETLDNVFFCSLYFKKFPFFRCVKLSVPNNNVFDALFSQVQEFITSCNGEQVRFAPDICKFGNSLIILIF